MKRFLPLAVALALIGCGAPQEPATTTPAAPVDSMAYRYSSLVLQLMGDWVDAESEPGAIIHERWKRTDDGFHSGIGFVMVGTDTVFIEHLSLAPDSAGRISYDARIPSQNGGDAVPFLLTACSGDSMVFENPAHDFPQRIVYALQADGRWRARVGGPGKDGAWRTERFLFSRAASGGL